LLDAKALAVTQTIDTPSCHTFNNFEKPDNPPCTKDRHRQAR